MVLRVAAHEKLTLARVVTTRLYRGEGRGRGKIEGAARRKVRKRELKNFLTSGPSESAGIKSRKNDKAEGGT